MNKNELRIVKPYLLLCEGRDELNFLVWYLQHLILENKGLDEIQVIDYGGINDLTKMLKALSKVSEFDKVKKIAVVRDAEQDWEASLTSVSFSMQESNIEEKLFVEDPFLFPGKNAEEKWQNGTLEDFTLKLLQEKCGNEAETCLILDKSKHYLHDVESARQNQFSRFHKNTLHTLFSSTDKFVGLKIGEAARAGAFNWENSELVQLKDFMMRLLIQ